MAANYEKLATELKWLKGNLTSLETTTALERVNVRDLDVAWLVLCGEWWFRTTDSVGPPISSRQGSAYPAQPLLAALACARRLRQHAQPGLAAHQQPQRHMLTLDDSSARARSSDGCFHHVPKARLCSSCKRAFRCSRSAPCGRRTT